MYIKKLVIKACIKIDSTFRGNLGSELEAVMDAFDSELTIWFHPILIMAVAW